MTKKQLESLSNKEQTVIRELLDPRNTLEAVLPDNTPPETLINNLTICCRAVEYLRSTTDKLKPIIGRLLCLIQNNPQSYQSIGYTNFDEFITYKVSEELKLCRSEAYECMRIHRAMPNLVTPEVFREIGIVKLKLLTRVTKEGEPSCETWLSKARSMTISEFKSEIVKQGLAAKGELQGAVIIINTIKEIADEWKSFLEDADIQAFVGTKDAGIILKSLMQEGRSSWIAQIHQAGKI